MPGWLPPFTAKKHGGVCAVHVFKKTRKNDKKCHFLAFFCIFLQFNSNKMQKCKNVKKRGGTTLFFDIFSKNFFFSKFFSKNFFSKNFLKTFFLKKYFIKKIFKIFFFRLAKNNFIFFSRRKKLFIFLHCKEKYIFLF